MKQTEWYGNMKQALRSVLWRLMRSVAGNPRRAALLRGMGSILDLAGPASCPRVEIPRVKPPAQVIREAWMSALSQFESDHGPSH